jgi:hypothetical protein
MSVVIHDTDEGIMGGDCGGGQWVVYYESI